MIDKQKRAPGSHGARPLSPATRKRMLAALLDRAEGGDAVAMEALVRLSWAAEDRTARATPVLGLIKQAEQCRAEIR